MWIFGANTRIHLISDNKIGACDIVRQKCVRLLDFDSDRRIQRRNLQVHSKAAQLYWIEEFHMTTVGMSNMDGTNVGLLTVLFVMFNYI